MTKCLFNRISLSIFFILLLKLTLANAIAVEPHTVPQALDQLAEQYVKLGLELGQYDQDYVDAYLGPKEWQKKAKEALRPKARLAKDIHALLQQLESLKLKSEGTALRHKALYRNVRAMDVRARMLLGETFSFSQEATLIYDATIPEYDFAKFDAVLTEIDKLVPGEGDLSQRVDAFRARFAIPKKKVNAVIQLAIAECKKRSNKYITLPSSEDFTLQYVTHKSWSGYNWYQGKNKSLMQINQDFPTHIDRAIELGCHEGYPGHHVWNVMIENKLLKQKKWIEYSIFPLFSPYALIAEGSANYGINLAFPKSQKIQFEQQVLFPKAGLDPATATNLDKLNDFTQALSHSITATAQLYLDGKINREKAIEQRRKYSLVSKEKAEQSIRFIEQYRAYVLNYNLGKDIVENYISSQGKNQAEKWQAFERMLTELSTGSDMSL